MKAYMKDVINNHYYGFLDIDDMFEANVYDIGGKFINKMKCSNKFVTQNLLLGRFVIISKEQFNKVVGIRNVHEGDVITFTPNHENYDGLSAMICRVSRDNFMLICFTGNRFSEKQFQKQFTDSGIDGTINISTIEELYQIKVTRVISNADLRKNLSGLVDYLD